MSSSGYKLNPPENFDFPFEPYKIQAEFMRELYNTIENKNIGIFESPTGTGKSLSLLCSALKWQEDNEALEKIKLKDKIEGLHSVISLLDATENDDWMTTQSSSINQKRDLKDAESKLQLNIEFDNKMKNLKNKFFSKKKGFNADNRLSKEKLQNENNTKEEQESNAKIVDDFLLRESDDENDENDESYINEQIDKYENVKIYYCSRTHSQLKQIMNEIKKTVYSNKVRVVTLASRQQYCINSKVKNLKSSAAINEKCLELKKSEENITSSSTDDGTTIKKKKNSTSCPFYSKQKITNFSNQILGEIIDMEDLMKFGEKEKICPYYSTRMASDNVQIILLPYQMLLHKSTREQIGINLNNNIVIIDEAHNLLDTICSIHSACITLHQLTSAHRHLTIYRDKYLDLFKQETLIKINQLIFVIYRFLKILEFDTTQQETLLLLVNEFIYNTNTLNVNFFTILEFCHVKRLAEKVHNFSIQFDKNKEKILTSEKKPPLSSTQFLLRKLEEEAADQVKNKNSNITNTTINSQLVDQTQTQSYEIIPNMIRPVLNFLERLTDKPGDGRILITYGTIKNNRNIKYILLNPETHFKPILDESRCVIIAGGTMQPTTEFKTQLFRSSIDKVKENFYGHVVTKDSVLPLVVTKGPTGIKFLFNYANRQNPNIIEELCRTIINVCNVVPEGIVCFFGSYDYMELFFTYLNQNKQMENLKKVKTVLRETRNCDDIKLLNEYNEAALDGRGGILFSVIGGKLSEGLNFSDHLGRCVIVVGLPYPNIKSPEIKEKMKYLDTNVSDNAGKEYYENLCMKAVNQSIGRSIRHIKDYASVILLDERYNQERIIKKLPGWISSNLKLFSHYGQIQSDLAKFFSNKKKEKL